MITESTGIPDTEPASTATAAAEPAAPPAAAPPAAAPPEPSQEAVLAELRTARKDGKEPDLSAPKAEPAKAEPPKEQALSGHERKLKDKHGESYKPSRDRQVHKAKIEEMGKRIAELEAKWKDTPPTAENQIEFTEDKFEHKTLTKEFNEKLGEYRAEIKAELSDRYGRDETFRAQHDHYGDMVFRDLEGAAEFSDSILTLPNGIDILHGLYDWLDKPGNRDKFLLATPEQRIAAVKLQSRLMSYAPRVPAAPPAAPAAPPASAAPATPANPVIPMSVKPDPAGTGGKAGFDLTKQEDCLKYVRQKRKEMA